MGAGKVTWSAAGRQNCEVEGEVLEHEKEQTGKEKGKEDAERIAVCGCDLRTWKSGRVDYSQTKRPLRVQSASYVCLFSKGRFVVGVARRLPAPLLAGAGIVLFKGCDPPLDMSKPRKSELAVQVFTSPVCLRQLSTVLVSVIARYEHEACVRLGNKPALPAIVSAPMPVM